MTNTKETTIEKTSWAVAFDTAGTKDIKIFLKKFSAIKDDLNFLAAMGALSNTPNFVNFKKLYMSIQNFIIALVATYNNKIISHRSFGIEMYGQTQVNVASTSYTRAAGFGAYYSFFDARYFFDPVTQIGNFHFLDNDKVFELWEKSNNLQNNEVTFTEGILLDYIQNSKYDKLRKIKNNGETIYLQTLKKKVLSNFSPVTIAKTESIVVA